MCVYIDSWKNGGVENECANFCCRWTDVWVNKWTNDHNLIEQMIF